MTIDGIHQALKRVYFLKGLSADELHLLAKVCAEEDFGPGDLIFEEGSTADRFYVLIEGHVEIWKDFRSESPKMLAVHGPGHFFGEIALIDELPRSATLVARDRVKVLNLARDDFRRLIAERTSIALAVMTGISSLIRSSNEIFVEDLRKRNVELEEANRALARIHEEQIKIEKLSTLGKFSSLILHDIRNPISMLKGQLQLIELESGDPEKVALLVKSCIVEVGRLERLANEFLDYSRGEIRLELSPTNATELLMRLSSSLKERFASAGIAIETRIECEESLLLDAERVLRALHNLADNSRKAMIGRKGLLSLVARREGGFLVIEVADTGEGMPPEVLSHVFEPFYSASNRGGTGLGMLIVRNIVEAHGGSIRIESALDEGTRIFLSFPLPSFMNS
ncbi:MAG TPA: ATP-binding protein [Rectinemataceae bacterium]|nr:ATP-binding protein [Rectinemataceae bacterium]